MRVCMCQITYSNIQIFVNQQTNISIGDIFVQAFRYRKGGKVAGYGSTVDVGICCVARKAGQLSA